MKKFLVAVGLILWSVGYLFAFGPAVQGVLSTCTGWNCGFYADANLISLWRFEGTSVLNLDETARDNDMTAGSDPAQDGTTKAEGTYSVALDGNDYYSRTDANLSTGFPTKSGDTTKVFTACGWFYLTADASSAIIGKSTKIDYSGMSWLLYRSGSTDAVTFVLGYNNGASQESLPHGGGTPTTTSLNTWYFACASFNGDTSKAYAIRVRNADGTVLGTDTTGTASNALSLTSAPLSIGCSFSDTTPINLTTGYLDEVSVWNKVLTADEVTRIAKGLY